MPKLSVTENAAVRIYDRRIQDGSFRTEPALSTDHFTQGIFNQIPEPKRVIDIGCGYGRAVPLLTQLGIETNKYVGYDASQASVNHCKTTWPSLLFEQGDLRQLGAMYPKHFSGFLAFAVLMHIPRSDLEEAMSSIRECLVDGARGAIWIPIGRTAGATKINDYGMKLTLYTKKEFEASLHRNRLVVQFNYSPNGFMHFYRVVAQ